MAKTQMIARKRVGKTAPGGTFYVARHEARALHALGLADYAPPVASPVEAAAPKRGYKRRDMVADQYETKLPMKLPSTRYDTKFVDAPPLPAQVSKVDDVAPFMAPVKTTSDNSTE